VSRFPPGTEPRGDTALVTNPDLNPASYGWADEIGVAANARVAWNRRTNQQLLESASEDTNPDLQFPESVPVYRQMSRTDGQVGSVLRAITNALQKAAWQLTTDGCRAEVVQFVRENIGLPETGDVLPRNRVSKVLWPKHLRDALSALTYGFSVFEQTYMPVSTDGALRLHLNKLSPRGQTTITRFEVERDGGLVAVWQRVDPTAGGLGGPVAAGVGWNDVRMPVERVVVYSHEREGADWSGTSLLRSAYKHWNVNDVVLRLSAQIIERNGMGIPGMEYDGVVVTKREAEQAVAEWRAGATAGLVYPKGSMPVLKGVEGTTPDPMPLMNYNDQAIGRSVLAMFLNLGHDNGARALGDTFVDAFTDSLQAEADWLGETFTEYVIADLVGLNWGPDEPYPALTSGSLASQALINAADLKLLTEAGLVVSDEATRTWVRDQYGLPPADDPSDDGVPEPPAILPVMANPAPTGDTARTGAAPDLAAAADQMAERVRDYFVRINQ
jgi:hypothetical protein